MTITTNDFQFDTSNKRIVHQSGSTTIFSVNALYSFIQDYFDELAVLSSSVPMSAQTPSAYTLIDGWFIDETGLEFLNAGAITTIGQDAGVYSGGVYVIYLSATGYTNCVSTDITLPVVSGSTSGTLLYYNNTLRKWWVRGNVGTTWSGSISITGGTGAGTFSSVKTGENTYSNIFTLGLLEPTVTNNIYVEQVNPELTNNKIPQFWGTGHIDILVKVKEANTPIDSGNVRVYCREYGTLYSHYSTSVISGGRTPLPISTIIDSNVGDTEANVALWTDVTVSFGSYSYDIGDGVLRPYNVNVNCGTRTNLDQVYEYLQHLTDRTSTATLNNYPGYFYRAAENTYLRDYTAPFGSYSGGTFFGARGVWLSNVPAAYINSYFVTDANNNTVSAPYASAGTLTFSTNLLTGGEGQYTMYFTSVPNGSYGTSSSVVVNNVSGTPISGLITSTSIPFSFEYTTNNQGGRTANTNAAVTIVAINPGYAQPTVVTYTITATKTNNITVIAPNDTAFI